MSDALWVNLKPSDSTKKNEVDLDDEFNFGDIKYLETFDNYFYVLANRLNSRLGQYLFEIPCDIEDTEE